jgi:hypothetical protein
VNWQGKLKYSEKTCPSAFCPPQTPHDLTRAQTRTATVGSRWLTAWVMAWPYHHHISFPDLLTSLTF